MQTIQRTLLFPDFVFSAGDLVSGPTDWPLVYDEGTVTVPRWDTNQELPGLAGPGTIQPPSPGSGPSTYTLNKVGPIYVNVASGTNGIGTTQGQADMMFAWGSFDGSTNAPIVYPNGASITDLENQILLSVTATDMIAGVPLGTTNVLLGGLDYSFEVQFSGSGGQPPYTWSMAANSPGLPPGFDAPTGTNQILANGIISGIPSAVGTYDVVIQMTDSAQRFIQCPYAIVISP
jgi:hypothetical protein